MAVCAYCHQQITGTDYRTYKSKRYHAACFEKLKELADQKDKAISRPSSVKEKEWDLLSSYVCELFQLSKISKALTRQAENIQMNDGLSFEQIRQGLWWFYEIEGHTPDTAHPNLGIAPYAYEECRDFFEYLGKAAKSNETAELKDEVVIVKPFAGVGQRLKMLTNMSEL